MSDIVYIVGITSGKMYLKQRSTVFGRFLPTQQEDLVKVLVDIGADKLRDAHIIGSSSMDFPQDDGWPDDRAPLFFQQALDKAIEILKQPAA